VAKPEETPRGQPLVTRCRACKADLGRASFIAIVDLPVIEQVMTVGPGRSLVPGPGRVTMAKQIIMLHPQRCPECNHAMVYAEQQAVTPP
jgi:uncharacterized protein with PIN domain